MAITANDITEYTQFVELKYDKLRRKIRQAQKDLKNNKASEIKSILEEADQDITDLCNLTESLYQKLHCINLTD